MSNSVISISEEGARARYFVSGTDVFVMGHYQGNPIFPGVLILDMLMDLAQALGRHRYGEASVSRIKRVQYLHASVPGDVLDLSASIKTQDEAGLQIVASAASGGTVRARATLECRPEAPHA